MGTHINAIQAHLATVGLEGKEHGDNQLVIQFRGNKMESIVATVVAPDDQENVGVRYWRLPKVPQDPHVRLKVYEALNEINHTMRFLKFFIDSDEEIIGAVDAVVTPETIGAITYELLVRGAYVVDDASQVFLPALGLDPAEFAPRPENEPEGLLTIGATDEGEVR